MQVLEPAKFFDLVREQGEVGQLGQLVEAFNLLNPDIVARHALE